MTGINNCETKKVTVTRTGVVHIGDGYDTELTVNSQNMISAIREAVEQERPIKDYQDRFAGRVTIIIELLGDCEPMKEEERDDRNTGGGEG